MRTSSGERFSRFKYTCAHKTLPFGTRLRVTNLKTGKSVVVRVSDRGPFRHQRIIDLAEVAARPLGIVEQGAATIIAQIMPATTPLGPVPAPRNLLALQAADPSPNLPFTTYDFIPASDSLATLAAQIASVLPTSPAQATQAALPTPALAASGFQVAVGSFAEAAPAQALRAHLLALDPTLQVELTEQINNDKRFTQVLISQLDSWLAAEAVQRRLQFWGIVCAVRQQPGPAAVVALDAASTTAVN